MLAAIALVPGQARAEDGLAAAVRDCRGLADTGARIACYDRIPLEETSARAAAPAPRVAAGFGSNQLPRSAPSEADGPERISVRVVRAVERQPGIYLLALEDGSEWQFVDSAPASYDPPRGGSTVEIARASLGSYLVRFAGQRAVRARRVR